MAGISISAIVGDNGVIVKARKASNETTKAQIQEELQLKIIDLQIEKEKTGEKITNSDIEGALGVLDGIEVDSSGKNVEGEYKEHGYKVDDNYNVIVTDRLTGDKPEGRAEVITKAENLEEVQIQVIGNLNGGEIESIEALDGAELLEKKSSKEYIFVVSDNLTYTFRIKGSNGRNITVTCLVDNAIPIRDDLLTAVAMINKTGLKKVIIKGQTNSDTEIYDEVKYSLNTTVYEGNMILDGKTDYPRITRSATTYSVGNSEDIGTSDSYAQNTVVLKVIGNLTVNSGVTLTSVLGYMGGPKGMIIYCTGKIINNGYISMDSRGAYAIGENVYLLKNNDNSFEFVPANGANGGKRSNAISSGYQPGNPGANGSSRGTGGGGAGCARVLSNRYCTARGGAGSDGTSYAGGCGGGVSVISGGNYSSHAAAGYDGRENRGGGGQGVSVLNGGLVSDCYGASNSGGLLIVYGSEIEGKGQFFATGVIGANTLGSVSTYAGGSGRRFD